MGGHHARDDAPLPSQTSTPRGSETTPKLGVPARASASTCGETSGAGASVIDSSLDIGRAPPKDPAAKLQGDASIAAGKQEAVGKKVANEVDGIKGAPVAVKPGYEVIAESGDTLVPRDWLAEIEANKRKAAEAARESAAAKTDDSSPEAVKKKTFRARRLSMSRNAPAEDEAPPKKNSSFRKRRLSLSSQAQAAGAPATSTEVDSTANAQPSTANRQAISSTDGLVPRDWMSELQIGEVKGSSAPFESGDASPEALKKKTFRMRRLSMGRSAPVSDEGAVATPSSATQVEKVKNSFRKRRLSLSSNAQTAGADRANGS